MTPLAVAAADPAARSSSAAALAARIPIPRRLPSRYDGQPMRHLSNSSYTKFLLCPDDWRRHYLLGQRSAPSGAMFLGGRVDDAVSGYYQHLLDHHEELTLEEIQDLYRDRWQQRLADEQAKLGVYWDDTLPEPAAFHQGLQALELTFTELVPHLGQPIAVQRKLEFALAPELEWTIQCFLDLETRQAAADGPPHETVIDYKVKTTPLTQAKADTDPQAALYLAGRWLAGDPADAFTFAQIARPGSRRKTMTASLVTTGRQIGQLRSSLARIAQAASQIVTHYERFGPEQPWGFADPTGWKCSRRYCAHHAHCPGGAGL